MSIIDGMSRRQNNAIGEGATIRQGGHRFRRSPRHGRRDGERDAGGHTMGDAPSLGAGPSLNGRTCSILEFIDDEEFRKGFANSLSDARR